MIVSIEIIVAVLAVVGVGALWEYVLGNVKKNRSRINELRCQHEDDVEKIEKRIDKKIEDIKDIVKHSSVMGQDERDKLTRIDQNVSNLNYRMEKLENRLDRVSRLKFKEKEGE